MTGPTPAGGPTSEPVPGFGARLHLAVDARGPLCVGIDPHPGLLAAWGLTDDARGLETFALRVVEAVGGLVALVKPQSAFFERHGSRGIAVLEKVLAALRDADTLSLLDVKRGDIGSTMQAYADAYLAPGSPLAADAITTSPYLGFGALEPALAAASAHGRGVFVLALTSNPEGAQVQAARSAEGTGVGEAMLREAGARNAGHDPWGPVGVVVGATLGQLPGLHGVLAGLNGPILAPGIGAQGATPADLPRLFGPAAGSVLPSVSREVLRAGPDAGALRTAAAALTEQCRAALAGRP